MTFDQPLYIKAVKASPELKNTIVRLGGFHLLMSFMGSIGYIMGGSGLESLWQTVYAPNTVNHMVTGHAYARALRAHLLTAAALVRILLQTPGCLIGMDISQFCSVQIMLLARECDMSSIMNEEVVQQLTHILHDLMADAARQSRTGKLWIQYLKQVQVIMLFIRAERTEDWHLHLHAVSK